MSVSTLPGCNAVMFVREPGMSDFFKTQARTPFEERFLIASLACDLTTNSEAVLERVRQQFLPVAGAGAPDFTFRVWVDAAAQPQPSPESPHFRGIGEIVVASFDRRNFLLMNVAKRRVIGRFTQRFVEDESGFGRTVFPVLVTALGPASGISVIHSACVSDQRRALLLAGASGSGKSTLALAFSELGYACVADDRTYISPCRGGGGLRCWGAGSRLKLRFDAARFFPEAVKTKAVDAFGSEVFEVDLAQYGGPERRGQSEPGWIVFLEPTENAGLELREISASEAATRLEDGIFQEKDGGVARQLELIQKVAERPAYICRYGGSPQAVARELADFFFSSGARRVYPVSTEIADISRPPSAAARDPLRRFTALRHRVPILLMGRRGVLETNSLRVRHLVSGFLERTGHPSSGEPAFLWKIAVEEGKRPMGPWPQPVGLAANGMRCVNLGETGFVAGDLEAREISGFTSENRVADEAGFAGLFLAAMAHLTAAALGVTPLSSACVVKRSRGLLLLGPPGCGKTTCAYATQKLGFEVHSDMVTFLELRGGQLRGWGEFWPALFRQETIRFHPELQDMGQFLEHESETFISVEKRALAPQNQDSVSPALALVLERGVAAMPRLLPLPKAKYAEILKASCPYAEEPEIQAHRGAVLSELLSLPAYKLIFGEDPAEAAIFCR
ncbi:MAG TPA: hypothetical protein VFZ08_14835, partial [Terriglobia bacterium]|nr:hypothetical protein [Terriglobia bacterium]